MKFQIFTKHRINKLKKGLFSEICLESSEKSCHWLYRNLEGMDGHFIISWILPFVIATFFANF